MEKDFIHFFGTTGDKDIFFNKTLSSGGLYISIDNTNIIIDPGPNTFYKYLKFYRDKIDGIILSHVHIDHSNDLNIFVELMTDGGTQKTGTVLLPNQAIEEKVLQPYVKNFPKELNTIKPNTKYKTKNHNIGLVTDTVYFPELINSYKGCETLIINVPYYIQNKPNPKHLEISNVEEFIKTIKPKKVILTHFGKNILSNNPSKIAESLKEKYNIDVIAAKDDMREEL